MYAHIKRLYDMAKTPNPDSLKLSLANTHHKNVFSLVIDGTEAGKLTRVFIAGTKIHPYDIALHSHTYPLNITVIKGRFRHYVAIPTDNAGGLELSEYDYRSPLNGGDGLSYKQNNKYELREYNMPVGSQISLTANDIHTVSCSKGSIWVVEEKGFESNKSTVLGVPFILDELYTKPELYQVNDMCQCVAKELKTLLHAYESCN